jgi:hypothetical protein
MEQFNTDWETAKSNDKVIEILNSLANPTISMARLQV